MEDDDFFDLIYQQWSKTTNASTDFWMSEKWEDHAEEDEFVWDIFAVGQDQERVCVVSGLREADADWITAMHGCLPDLVRRLHMAIDESERLDIRADDQEGRIADLEMELADQRAIIESLTKQLDQKDEQVAELPVKLSDEKGWSAYLQTEIDDLRGEMGGE